MGPERRSWVWIVCLGALLPLAMGFSPLLSSSANLSAASSVRDAVASSGALGATAVARWIGPPVLAVLPLALVPLLEARRPRRRAIGSVLSLCIGGMGVLTLIGVLFPGAAVVLGLLLVPLASATGFTTRAAYVGCLTQSDRVRYLLPWTVGVMLGLLVAGTVFPMLFFAAGGPGFGAGLAALVLVAMGVATAAAAGWALPHFGEREAPARTPGAVAASAWRELTALPGAWRAGFLFVACPVPVLLFRAGAPLLLLEAPDRGGLGLSNQQFGLVVGTTGILALVGALVAWAALLKAPVTRVLWVAVSLLLLLAPCWTTLLVVRASLPTVGLCFAATTAISGFVELTCLVVVFRVFGDARHYLSALAVAIVGGDLVARASDALVPLAGRLAGALPGVPEGVGLVVISAIVAGAIGIAALALMPGLSLALVAPPAAVE